MINKERLEELIEQGATIYRTYANCSVIEYKLDKNYVKVDNAFLWRKMKGAFKGCGYPLDQLFETKEEAEWHCEFGCIERTERLEFPTWEEIEKDFNIINKFGTYEIVKFAGKKTENDYVLAIFVDNYSNKFISLSCFVRQPLTKENYTLACRKCKELFLGVKDE